MDTEKKGRELTSEEEKELREGNALYEMDQTSQGWQIVKKWFEDRAYHSWTSPLETNSEKEWVWRELNLYHSAQVAKQLLEDITKAISQAEYLGKIKSGEIQTKKFRL